MTLDSSLESIDQGEELARNAAAQAGLNEDEQFRVSLAVRECLINAHLHGNRADPRKKIFFELKWDASDLVFVVADQGDGFRADLIPDPTQNEQLLADSGRGLFLIRTFMDEVTIEPGADGGTRATLRKSLTLANSTAGVHPEKE